MITATYDPLDNKLRLYPTSRLDTETYNRVKATGFKWAPKQELFVAPMWTPEREDLALELCGEIGDEDTSLVERAEERAERFTDYSIARKEDANQAHEAVKKITDMIPLGQPILLGHHSQRHAERDAERIQSGMRKAVNFWNQSKYWEDRAKGALRHAKYKERPDVRARRIKGLEADKRKQEKTKAEAEVYLKLWSKIHAPDSLKRKDGQPTTITERALYLANRDSYGGVTLPDGSHYWSAWGALTDGKITAEEVQRQRLKSLPRIIARCNRWLAHLENRLTYERAMLAENGGTAADKKGPEKGGACRCWCSPRGGWSYIQKVNKVSVTVLDNWGNGGKNFTRTVPFTDLKAVMSKAEVEEKRDAGVLVEDDYQRGFYLRSDSDPEPKTETADERHKRMHAEHMALKEKKDKDIAAFEALRESLRQGVKVVTAPQLFPTPPELAVRIIALADIQPEHEVLEPSAGTGNLMRLCYSQGFSDLVAVEINPTLVQSLANEFPLAKVVQGDFINFNGDLGKFDRILMNPPFAGGEDIKHILHARKMLKPGGTLVAICANGPRQQEQLKPLAETWEPLPPNTFEEQGTRVNTVLLTMRTID